MGNKENGNAIIGRIKKVATDSAKVAVPFAVLGASLTGCDISRDNAELIGGQVGGAIHDAASTQSAREGSVAQATAYANQAEIAVAQERKEAIESHGGEFEPWTCWSPDVYGPGYKDKNGDNKRNDDEPWERKSWGVSPATHPDGTKRVLWEKGQFGAKTAANIVECADACHPNDPGKNDWCEPKDGSTPVATATSTKTLTPTSGATATLTPTTGSTDVAPSATSTRTLTPKPNETKPTPVATATLTPTTGSTDVAPSATPTRTPTPVASPTGITCTPIPDINTVQIFADGRPLTTDPKDFGAFAANVPVARLDGWEHAWLADGSTDRQEGTEFGPNRMVQILSIHGSDSPDYEGFDIAPTYPVASVQCPDSPLDIDTGIMSVTGLTPEQFLRRQSVVGTGCFRVEPDASGDPTNVNFRSMGPTWQQAINGVTAINSTFSGHGWKHFLNKQIWGTPSEPQLGVNRGPGMIEEFTFNRGDQLDADKRVWRICPDGKFEDDNMSTNFDADVSRITGSSPEALLEKLSVVGPVCMIAHN